ncbi:FadR/GntR family transcriptional regulator [Ornithinibacillus bavariensis]|uniref:GntR family transcriptional regulator n=1 Tax=Ornithinibacillus bavariensis TaxID=545502 RepID=A0A919XC19_9BACI|nr:GntR family transcriptional regulator [Ornithinibacillus bavariensis]GIO27813.1 GntR family transcriptional regulator [Ornithinibacillus bavariensis]
MSMSPKQKVYQEVLHEVRNFIEFHNLSPGDKLPSERELAEKLGAGRSSVREALRAMELLGIIETRHGEGTFLSEYRPYQTVELLSSFVLKENTPKKELIAVKMLLEKEAAKLVFTKMDESVVGQLQNLINNPDLSTREQHFTFFSLLFALTENHFLARIWGLIDEYTHNLNVHYSNDFYHRLLNIYKSNRIAAIEGLFLEEKMPNIM